MQNEKNGEQMESEPRPGEERIIEGVKMRWSESGYSIREFYLHDGPGWDYHLSALEKYGVRNVSDLPESKYYRWTLV